MLKVDLITVGKLKEDYLRRACEEYQKRLGAFVKLQIIELPEGKMPQDPSAAQIESCLAQEGQSILSKIPLSLIHLSEPTRHSVSSICG